MPTRYGTGLDAAELVFLTVIGTWETAVSNDAGTCAVNWVLLTYVVARAVVPKLATAPDAKSVPVKYMVNAGSPTDE